MKKQILYLISIIMIIASTSLAGSFQEAKSKSMFTDIKAHQVGDVLTVLVVEDARATNRAKTITKKETKAETKGGPAVGGGLWKYIGEWGLSGNTKSEYDGEGRLEKSGAIKAKMTVRVIAVSENGDLAIEGSRVMSINSDKETLFLSGIVRQKDISASNTIYSYQVADAQVSFKGKGQTHDGARPGMLTRIINWIF